MGRLILEILRRPFSMSHLTFRLSFEEVGALVLGFRSWDLGLASRVFDWGTKSESSKTKDQRPKSKVQTRWLAYK